MESSPKFQSQLKELSELFVRVTIQGILKSLDPVKLNMAEGTGSFLEHPPDMNIRKAGSSMSPDIFIDTCSELFGKDENLV